MNPGWPASRTGAGQAGRSPPRHRQPPPDGAGCTATALPAARHHAAGAWSRPCPSPPPSPAPANPRRAGWPCAAGPAAHRPRPAAHARSAAPRRSGPARWPHRTAAAAAAPAPCREGPPATARNDAARCATGHRH
ncbi:hypothetical protein G6F68_014578 [Rhizopus microsporus]|nr:hypothetical protein G6F68_014578 [Rhizopus microsporus]